MTVTQSLIGFGLLGALALAALGLAQLAKIATAHQAAAQAGSLRQKEWALAAHLARACGNALNVLRAQDASKLQGPLSKAQLESVAKDLLPIAKAQLEAEVPGLVKDIGGGAILDALQPAAQAAVAAHVVGAVPPQPAAAK
jgi:hypothetical protein